MKCEYCGNSIPEGAKFCPACGGPVQEAAPAAGGDKGEEKVVIEYSDKKWSVFIKKMLLFWPPGGAWNYLGRSRLGLAIRLWNIVLAVAVPVLYVLYINSRHDFGGYLGVYYNKNYIMWSQICALTIVGTWLLQLIVAFFIKKDAKGRRLLE